MRRRKTAIPCGIGLHSWDLARNAPIRENLRRIRTGLRRSSPRHLALLGVLSRSMNRETLKGHLDLLVLSVLADGPLHGYAVIEQLRTRSGEVFDLAEGTVYPVLHRLELSGLLTSEWSEVAGRRRRSYRLTRAGTAQLEDKRESWHIFSSTVDSVLRRKPWPTTP